MLPVMGVGVVRDNKPPAASEFEGSCGLEELWIANIQTNRNLISVTPNGFARPVEITGFDHNTTCTSGEGRGKGCLIVYRSRVLKVGSAGHDVLVVSRFAVDRILIHDMDPGRTLVNPGRDRTGNGTVLGGLPVALRCQTCLTSMDGHDGQEGKWVPEHERSIRG